MNHTNHSEHFYKLSAIPRRKYNLRSHDSINQHSMSKPKIKQIKIAAYMKNDTYSKSIASPITKNYQRKTITKSAVKVKKKRLTRMTRNILPEIITMFFRPNHQKCRAPKQIAHKQEIRRLSNGITRPLTNSISTDMTTPDVWAAASAYIPDSPSVTHTTPADF